MKVISLCGLAASLTLAVAPMSVSAHHSFETEFSRDLPVEVTGKVSRVEWTNPHARFYVDVEDENGEIITWNFELSAANMMMRRGWTRNSLKIDDVVTVTGFRARNAEHVAEASRGSVTLADGQTVFGRGAPGDTDQ